MRSHQYFPKEAVRLEGQGLLASVYRGPADVEDVSVWVLGV